MEMALGKTVTKRTKSERQCANMELKILMQEPGGRGASWMKRRVKVLQKQSLATGTDTLAPLDPSTRETTVSSNASQVKWSRTVLRLKRSLQTGLSSPPRVKDTKRRSARMIIRKRTTLRRRMKRRIRRRMR